MIDVFNKTTSNFSYKLEGDSQIDAETLAIVLSNTVHSLQYINSKENSDAFVRVNVNCLESGSFVINLTAITSMIPTLLNGNYSYAKSLLDILIDCFKIKQFLKGEKPKEINNGTIINASGESRVFNIPALNIYINDPKIDSDIGEIFEALGKDKNKKALIVKHNNDEKLRVEQSEYEMMKSPIISSEIINNLQTKIQEVIADLLVKKVDFVGNSQWEFIYNKNINASIMDLEWLDTVKKGKVKLYAGVSLKVKLRVEVDYDENMEPVKDKYSVLEVIDVIYPKDYPSLF
ncbi:MAG: hypothetical protein AWM53_01533 [Candidatus Dichloromethanomonas elyunquensis]|nr:MAG: hypothetical protein AWM53_01533 [Candidatus Dichloromethanomonas elyunquensis]